MARTSSACCQFNSFLFRVGIWMERVGSPRISFTWLSLMPTRIRSNGSGESVAAEEEQRYATSRQKGSRHTLIKAESNRFRARGQARAVGGRGTPGVGPATVEEKSSSSG